MNKKKYITNGVCQDCGREDIPLTINNICKRCETRRINSRNRNTPYIPYKDLTEKQKRRIDSLIMAQNKRNEEKKKITLPPVDLKDLEAPDSENYYQAKATQTPVSTHTMKKAIRKEDFNPLSDQKNLIRILKLYNCEISEEDIQNILNKLVAVDKIRNILADTSIEIKEEDKLSKLEQSLDTVEKQLQADWENSGFQEIKDLEFKGFLIWKKFFKTNIPFWKQLQQINFPNKVEEVKEVVGEKRFQVTTESISTIYNSKRPFTRIFCATSEDDAHKQLSEWLHDHQLHENKTKTVITELN